MAGIRFLTADRTASTTAAIDTVSPVQDANFPQSNTIGAAGKNRFAIWRTPDPVGADPVNVDIDLQTPSSVHFAAICGFRPQSTSPLAGPFSCTLFSGDIFPPATSRATFSLITDFGARDYLGEGFPTSPVSARYWRFQFSTIVGYFSVGRLVVGTLTDIGGASPGGFVVSPFLPGGALVGPGGHQHEFYGRDRGDVIQVTMRGVSGSVVNGIRAAQRFGPGLLMIDMENVLRQVRFPQGSPPQITTRWDDGVTRLYDVSFTLERIP